MGSPGTEDRTYILSVNIQDGKAFGPDLQAIACAATFAGETKLTPYSVGRDTHVWNTTLQWRVTMDQFRRLTSLGQKDCKVVLTNKDGTKLGWFLVDVRAAKLQAQYKKDDGVWVNLTGAKKGETPQVCMLALFYEDRPNAFGSPEPKSPGKPKAKRPPAAARAPAAAAGPADSAADDPGMGAAGVEVSARAADGGSGGAGTGGALTGPTGTQRAPAAAGAPPARNATAGLPNFGSPQRNPADDGPFRHFALTVDVRTFQSSKRLPLSSASVYVQAVLPTDLIELVVSSGFRLPSRLAPLTSHPAVDIPRGAEGALPNGYGTVEFSAGVVQLARVLAAEPRISVEAWHKERFRADMLLGAGSVPLTPLLQGAWVDGYAPLFAIVASSVAGELREERVQMGMLRVILSLEDKGPVPTPGAPSAAASAAPAPGPAAAVAPTIGLAYADVNPAAGPAAVPSTEAEAVVPSARGSDSDAAREERPIEVDDPAALAEVLTSGAPAAMPVNGGGELQIREIVPPPMPTEPVAAAASVAPAPPSQRQPALLPPAHSRAAPPTVSLASPPRLAAGGAAGGRGSAVSGLPAGLQGAPEFEAAWELEVWKKAEEARWRSELREREAQRMLVLESEWRRRERAREAEIASLKADYLGLEEKAQQVLAAAEGRERRILAAEEALLRRRKELEREHSGRMVEAEAAVRRLQVECEHQLDIERDRNAELVRRVAMLEERLAASEMRCLTVENEFADFRAAARSTPEAELARQLAEAREAAKAAEARAAKAAKAKQGYKEQVRKLAEQLAALQRRRNRDEDGAPRDSSLGRSYPSGLPLPPSGPGPVPAANVAAIRATAEEQARYAASQQQELAAMRAQLQAIKAAALAQLSPPASPRGGGSGAAGAGGRAPAPGGGGWEAERADDAADLRSVDQQRHGRSDWREGGSMAGPRAPQPGGSRPHTPLDTLPGPHHPGDTPVHPAVPPGSSTSSADSTSGSGGSNGRSQQPQAQPAQPVHAQGQRQAQAQPQAPVVQPGGRARWAEPRPSSSAPTIQERRDGPGMEADWGQYGHVGEQPSPVSAPPAVYPPSSGPYSRDDAPPPHQQQPRQRVIRQWQRPDVAPAHPPPPGPRRDQGTDVPGSNSLRASHPDDDEDPDAEAWASPPRWPPAAAPRNGGHGVDTLGPGPAHPQPQATGPSMAGGPAAAGARPGPEEPRRSLADHLANASVAAARTRQHEGPGAGPAPAPRATWQVPVEGRAPVRGPAAASAVTANPQSQAAAPPAARTASTSTSPPPQQPTGAARGDGAGRGAYVGAEDIGVGPDGGFGLEGDDGDYGYHDEAAAVGGGNRDGLYSDLAEIQRLTRRKMELLQSGYGMDDSVVQVLDERIQALLAAAGGLA